MGQRKGGRQSTVPGKTWDAGSALRLRKLRSAAGVKGKVVARSIGVSQSLISKLECGKQKLDPEKAQKLARYYRVTPEYILYGKTNDTRDARGEAHREASGLQEEGEAFEAYGSTASAEPAIAGKPRKLSPFTIKTDDLAAFGYPREAVLAVDFEPPPVAQLANGSLVIVEVTARGKARRLARQFVAPNRLCCSSGRSTGPVLTTGDAGVTIVGIIYGELDEAPSRKPSVKRRRKPG